MRCLKRSAQHEPAVIFIAYPNNPTGNLFDARAISRIIEAAPGLVVVDEAYHAFADASFMDKLLQYPNLLLMRTLSKLGLAGLRLGLLAGGPEWLRQLEKLRLPYNVGIVTQLIAEKVLQHRDVLLQQAAAIKNERAMLGARLAAMRRHRTFSDGCKLYTIPRERSRSRVSESQKTRRIDQESGWNTSLAEKLPASDGGQA